MLEGALVYRILEPVVREERLEPGRDGLVEPQVPHEVAPIGHVLFYVEFLRPSTAPDGPDRGRT